MQNALLNLVKEKNVCSICCSLSSVTLSHQCDPICSLSFDYLNFYTSHRIEDFGKMNVDFSKKILWTPILDIKCCTGAASSSISYFRYGFYVLTGWLSGTGEPVLMHKDLLVGVVGGE